MNKFTAVTWRRLRTALSGVLATGMLLCAHAQPVVQAVTSSLQGGSEVLRIDFSQPLTAVPALRPNEAADDGAAAG